MTETDAIESAVVERVAAHAPVSLEDLQQRHLRQYTWNRLFAAIDRLSRRNAITLRRIDRQTYLLTLGPSTQQGRTMTSASPESSRRIIS